MPIGSFSGTSAVEPEPRWEDINRMLEPGNRPPGLRHADRDALMPSLEECRARLIQWCDDVLQELAEDYERVWEIEAPQLARRTNPKAIVTDVYAEQRIHRASREYRAMYYKAHNASRRSRNAGPPRKRKRGRMPIGRIRADLTKDRRPADCAGHAGHAAEPEAAPAAVAPACEPGIGPQDEPLIEVEAPMPAEAPAPPEGAEVGSQNGPSFGANGAVESPAPDVVVAVIARSSDQDTPASRSFHRVPGRRRKRAGRGNRGVRRATPNGGGAGRPTPIGEGESALAAQRPSPGLRPPSPGGSREGRYGSRNEPPPGSRDDWRSPPAVTKAPEWRTCRSSHVSSSLTIRTFEYRGRAGPAGLRLASRAAGSPPKPGNRAIDAGNDP